jgi:hypothetical protein
MRSFLAVLAYSCICLLLVPAWADPFVSDQYHFTADFPAPPTVGTPQGSETDERGNFISTSVMIQTQVQGVYTAMVTVDNYVVPLKIDTPSLLLAMAHSFVDELNAKTTASKSGKLDGYRARFFSYDTPDHSKAGKGIVVIVPGKKPRTYLVVTMYTPLASQDEIAALDSFIASFHTK